MDVAAVVGRLGYMELLICMGDMFVIDTGERPELYVPALDGGVRPGVLFELGTGLDAGIAICGGAC